MALPNDSMTTERLLKELEKHRRLQKGMFPNNDENYTKGELLSAAMSYADLAQQQIRMRQVPHDHLIKKHESSYIPPGGTDYGYNVPKHMMNAPGTWPFNPNMWLPKGPRYNLIRAATLIVAELERLERLDRKLFVKEKPPKKEPKEYNNPHVPYWDDAAPLGTTASQWGASYTPTTPTLTIGQPYNVTVTGQTGTTLHVNPTTSAQLQSTGTI